MDSFVVLVMVFLPVAVGISFIYFLRRVNRRVGRPVVRREVVFAPTIETVELVETVHRDTSKVSPLTHGGSRSHPVQLKSRNGRTLKGEMVGQNRHSVFVRVAPGVTARRRHGKVSV